MAARIASRCLARRFSSSGRVLSEEEKAAENVYIKQEKLEKLARKGPKSIDHSGPEIPAATDVKPAGLPPGSSKAGVSTDQKRNYAVISGTVAAVSALGWFLLSKPKRHEEVSD